MDPLTIQLSRDEARSVEQKFFPYMESLCAVHIRNAGRDQMQIFNCRAVHCMLLQVKRQWERKLIGTHQEVTFNLQYPEVYAVYKLLKHIPIGDDLYLKMIYSKLLLEMDYYLLNWLYEI